MSGKVTLVGAGPGAPDLLTLRAVNALEDADVVLHDRLIDPAILDICRINCKRIDVGKRVGRNQSIAQGSIMDLLIRCARKGQHVVRLKGGDPFVFGRGGEEIAVLKAAGIAYSVVPGVSSVLAAPASADIPLTYRGLAMSFGVFTARTGEGMPSADLRAAAQVDTAVILMGASRLSQIARDLRTHGRARHTPVAVISRATLPDAKTWIGTLGDLEQDHRFEAPSTMVVGPTVTVLREAVQQLNIS